MSKMMKCNLVIAATASFLGASAVSGAQSALQERGVASGIGGGAASAEVYYTQDPADSLYRAARSHMNRGSYREAARAFREVGRRYRTSSYVGRSLYWEAYSLYRDGGEDELREARDAVRRQMDEHPDAARRSDSQELEALIQGRLANDYGDAAAAEWIQDQASFEQQERDRDRDRDRDQDRRGACPEEDDDVRVAAINALMNMNSERAVPILQQVLERRDACSAQLRKKAVFVLSQQNTEEVTDILLDAAKNDPSREVREAAVFWISQVSSERAVDALEDILRTEDDLEIKKKALFALSQHGSPKAGGILRDYARRSAEPRELRETAVFWLGQDGGRENGQFLRDLYGEVNDRELKEKIIFSLSQMGGSGDWLLEIARDRSEDVELRKKAIFWAGQTTASMADFVGLYDTSDAREIREQLIFAFSQSSSDAAIEKLMDIAKNDPEAELKKKAIFWLGQSNDPRVAEFLLELINQ